MNILKTLKGIFQRKTYDGVDLNKTFLSRCLTTLDLTALGVGSTLGAGVYVVTGQVARQSAGPGVLISFFIAAAASVLAGLCYAEFGARVPRTGSAYIYSYVSVGELMAFIIGWNLILEYVIGTASVARAWSANLDEVIGGHIRTFFNSTMPMHLPGLAEYPDWFSFLITILLTILLSIGVKESSRFNNIFTVFNLSVVLYAVVCGMWNADINNWRIDPKTVNITNITVNYDIGSGYFLPFGFSGLLSGAGTCFYAFIGFDSISTTGEEVINPQKAIPISIITCLTTCFFAYASIAAMVTLVCPYYLINADAPLPFVFDRLGWVVSKYIVGFGAIFGLSTSLLGSMFPLPRILYAMASDGLIFKFLARINPRFKTPMIATFVSGLLAALMSALFDLKSLVDMMSIGTLLAYSLVAFSVLMLRGCKDPISDVNEEDSEIKKSFIDESEITFKEYLRYLMKSQNTQPTKLTDFITKVNTYIIFVLIFLLNFILVQPSFIRSSLLIAISSIIIGIISLFCITLWFQPESPSKISFKVPGVPWLPVISMTINIHLMMKLPVDTWYRFVIWMTIGFIIYFAYGIWHSDERMKKMKLSNSLNLINVKSQDESLTKATPDISQEDA